MTLIPHLGDEWMKKKAWLLLFFFTVLSPKFIEHFSKYCSRKKCLHTFFFILKGHFVFLLNLNFFEKVCTSWGFKTFLYYFVVWAHAQQWGLNLEHRACSASIVLWAASLDFLWAPLKQNDREPMHVHTMQICLLLRPLVVPSSAYIFRGSVVNNWCK